MQQHVLEGMEGVEQPCDDDDYDDDDDGGGDDYDYYQGHSYDGDHYGKVVLPIAVVLQEEFLLEVVSVPAEELWV